MNSRLQQKQKELYYYSQSKHRFRLIGLLQQVRNTAEEEEKEEDMEEEEKEKDKEEEE